MPVEIKFLANGAGVELTGIGTIAGQDLIDAGKKVYSSDQVSQMKYQLIDFSSVEHFSVTPEDALCCAKQDTEAAGVNSEFVIAIVAPTKLAYGICRIWDAYMEPSGIKRSIFSNRDEAMTWLRHSLSLTN